MKINIPEKRRGVTFTDIEYGGFFWLDGTLYMKPRILLSDKEMLNKHCLAVDLQQNLLAYFGDQSSSTILVIPEHTPLNISF
jgi:hypothetical protein